MTDLAELLERVEKAKTWRDAPRSWEIAGALGAEIGTPKRMGSRYRNVPWLTYDTSRWQCIPNYVGSLDEVLTLMEQMRPGVFWHVAKGRLTATEPLYGAQLLIGSDECLGIAEHPASPTLALLAALLRSLVQASAGGEG